MTRLIQLAVVMAVNITAGQAIADQILFDNGLKSNTVTSGQLSDYDTSPVFDAQGFHSDDFFLPNSILTGVRWSGFYAFDNTPPPNDDFEIAFYEDNGFGTPVQNPFLSFDMTVTRDSTKAVVGPFDVYSYTANFAPILWADPSTFWVSIRNRTFNEVDDWFWGAVPGVGNSHVMIGGGPWFPTTESGLDFVFTGTVIPEPSSSALHGVFLFAAFTRRR